MKKILAIFLASLTMIAQGTEVLATFQAESLSPEQTRLLDAVIEETDTMEHDENVKAEESAIMEQNEAEGETVVTGQSVVAEDAAEEIIETIEDAYDYPIIPGTREWVELGKTSARRDACEIPEEILGRLTTEALVTTAFRYPLNTDIYAFEDIRDGFNYISKYSNAWTELLSREDLGETILSMLDSDTFDDAEMVYIELLLNHPEVLSRLSEETRELLNSGEVFALYNPPPGAYLVSETVDSKTIYTPKERRAVTLQTWRYEWYPYKVEELDNNLMEEYSAAYYIGPSTMRYNCFSYAFYLQSTTNRYNLSGGINEFLDDGSYVRVSSPRPGDIALYWDSSVKAYSHVGIVTTISPEVWVCSKWGHGPLMEHPVMECPYEKMGVQYYRLYTKL